MSRKGKIVGVIAACAAVALIAIALAATSYAQPGGTARSTECISELAIAVGSDGVAQLEENDFTVVSRPLCDGSEVYVAYKRGGTPITGLAASAGDGGMEINGIGYGLVGDVDLGAGVRDPIYLYATTDGAAGQGIISFSVESSPGTLDDAPLALRNDGTSPLRDETGRPMDFGVGSPAYVYVLRKEVVKPYVSDLRAVSGADLREAVLEAAVAGFDYYYDPGLSTPEGSYVVIGYNRTADANAAITCVTARPAEEQEFQAGGVTFERKGDVVIAEAMPYVLFATRDHAAGNAILDFTGSSVPTRATDVLGKWTERTFVKFASAASAQQAKTEPLYGDLIKSTSEFANVAVLMANGDSTQAAQPAQPEQTVEETGGEQPTDEAPSDQEGQEGTLEEQPGQPAQSEQTYEIIVEGEDVPSTEFTAEAEEAQKAAEENGADAESAANEDGADDATASDTAESNGVTTSLAYVCVAADMPASLFGKANDATISTETPEEAETKRQAAAQQQVATQQQEEATTATEPAEQQEQVVTTETIEVTQEAPAGDDVQFEEYVDDFDQATYLSAQPEVITLGGDTNDYAASAFGPPGTAGALVVAGGMAVVGALLGFVAFVLVKRWKEARHEE